MFSIQETSVGREVERRRKKLSPEKPKVDCHGWACSDSRCSGRYRLDRGHHQADQLQPELSANGERTGAVPVSRGGPFGDNLLASKLNDLPPIRSGRSGATSRSTLLPAVNSVFGLVMLTVTHWVRRPRCGQQFYAKGAGFWQMTRECLHCAQEKYAEVSSGPRSGSHGRLTVRGVRVMSTALDPGRIN